MKASDATKNALKQVLEARDNETILIICDKEKNEIGEAFATGALDLGLQTKFWVLQEPKENRTEIPKQLEKILDKKTDIYINLLKGNREETPFRIQLIKKQTSSKESRLGHCPGVTLDMLTDGALALTLEEHKMMQDHATKLMKKLQGAEQIDIKNPAGTHVIFSTKNRPFFTDTKLDWKNMKWMNLPTGEVIVAPIEDSLNGKLLVDLAIGGIGKIEKPMEISIKKGRVENVFSQNREELHRVKRTFSTDNWSDVVGEFAFGINPHARFVDEFLESEKILGTIHLAFGSNIDMPGGKNPSKNHMDLLISLPTVKITKENKEQITILEKGHYLI
ncbi:MAG: aminopeptidase [Candidatus Bathyarchaeota archaeon]